MNLSDYDTDFAPASKRLNLDGFRAIYALLPAPEVPCGYFCLTVPDGSRRHFRVRLERSGLFVGKRAMARLTSPTLEAHEWESVGLVTAGGFAVFKRWKNDYVARHAGMLWEMLHGRAVEDCALVSDVRCRWSMRRLKTDTAIANQINDTAALALGLVDKMPRGRRGRPSE